MDGWRVDGWMVDRQTDGEAPPPAAEHLLTCVCAVGVSGRARLRGWEERSRGDGGGGRGSGSCLGLGRSCCVQRAGRATVCCHVFTSGHHICVS